MPNLDPETNRYVQRARQAPKLDREEERVLLEAAARGDRPARERLVTSHLRDVVFLAIKYRYYGLPVSELIAEGNMGLVHALGKYEASHGTRFGTYAAYWVRAYVVTHILRSWSMVRNRTGVLRTKLFFRLRRERAKLESLHGEGEETNRLLAERLGVTEERLGKLLARLDARDVSFDAPLGESTRTLADELPSDLDQESSYALQEIRGRLGRALHDALPELDPRERFIVESRWLAQAPDELSLADVGRKLGVSRERARQLESRARTKLARALTERHGATPDWLNAATAA